MQWKKPVSMIASAAMLCGLFATRPTTVRADTLTIDDLGDLTHYNGILFGDFEAAQADVEGALAVNGTSKIGTVLGYDVGGAHESNHAATTQVGIYTNPNGWPTLLLNDTFQLGKPDGTGHVGIFGGPVVMNETLESHYNSHPVKFDTSEAIQYVPGEMADTFFVNAYDRYTGVAQVLALANTDPEASFDIADCYWADSLRDADMQRLEADNLTGTGNMKILVVNFEDEGAATIRGPYINAAFENYDLIIFNFLKLEKAVFESESIHIWNGSVYQTIDTSAPANNNAQLASYAGKVIWNFPIAQEIQVNSAGIVGSVLAPEASLTAKGGSINGMLVAKDFTTTGGMELHAFRINPKIFELGNEDESPEGGVQLIKRDADDDTAHLSGAVFRLEALVDGVWTDYATDEPLVTGPWGDFTIEGLPVGRYRLIETGAPDGFVLDDAPIEFEIEEGHGVIPLELNVTNQRIVPDPIDVELTKVAEGAPLDGATFTFYKMEEGLAVEQYDITSVNGGQLVLSGLTEGEYRLVEKNPPEGYTVPDAYRTIYIDVAPDGNGQLAATVANEAGALDPSVIVNEPVDHVPATRLEIIKLDGVDGETALDGAVFDLYHWENNDWALLHSGIATDGYGSILFEDLPFGDYRLVETSPPEGYEISEAETFFTLDEVGWQEGETLFYQHDVYDQPIEEPEIFGSLTVNKIDSETSEPLAGARFELWRVLESGNELIDTFTMETGVYTISGLPLGEYTLIELDAPEGYELGETTDGITLTVEAPDGSVTVENTATPVEPEPLGSLTVYKEDSDTHAPLSGAAFELWQVLETGDVLVEAFTMDSGAYTITGLPLGEYRLVETSAPEGYRLDTASESVALTVEARDREVTVENTAEPTGPEPTTGSLRIAKTDQSGEALGGAMFQLSRVEADGTHTMIEVFTIDESGTYTIEGLEPGEYVLEELQAPYGYAVDTEVKGITIAAGTPAEVKVVNRQILGRATIVKIDAEEGTELPGAVFDLEKMGETDWVPYRTGLETDEAGHLEIEALPAGEYRLVETKAPDGYLLPEGEHTRFEVLPYGEETVDLGSFTVPNSREEAGEVLGRQQIWKVSAEDGTTTLAGAVFDLYHDFNEQDGAYLIVQSGLETDEDGLLTLEDLPLGGYMLVETEAPDGFELLKEPVYFEITQADGAAAVNTPLTIENEPVELDEREETTSVPSVPDSTTSAGSSDVSSSSSSTSSSSETGSSPGGAGSSSGPASGVAGSGTSSGSSSAAGTARSAIGAARGAAGAVSGGSRSSAVVSGNGAGSGTSTTGANGAARSTSNGRTAGGEALEASGARTGDDGYGLLALAAASAALVLVLIFAYKRNKNRQ